MQIAVVQWMVRASLKTYYLSKELKEVRHWVKEKTWSKSMRERTNTQTTPVKVLKQKVRLQEWQGGHALEKISQRKSSRRGVREVTSGRITWGLVGYSGILILF